MSLSLTEPCPAVPLGKLPPPKLLTSAPPNFPLDAAKSVGQSLYRLQSGVAFLQEALLEGDSEIVQDRAECFIQFVDLPLQFCNLPIVSAPDAAKTADGFAEEVLDESGSNFDAKSCISWPNLEASRDDRA
eukprot:CAMPEP_0206546454 /NCGR_PEP_ID=MMETSP0325_2-20121206/12721_1 /ASSEMBLY_ACC=CAM_ASM_000347 /TAXON_ID=2866 /ORGANISM="Crypthecodinium cohnii, Strain Seligo" /LENGTH=130 /DNA_ID=CAMNT_0054045593 /DNA_START=700 /DNA_END=1094 /DNA_ORIENTATION=-